MRFLVAVFGVLLLATAGCGDNPVDYPLPEDVDIQVSLDWPMAREDGFVAARWDAHTRDFGNRVTIYAEGVFDANGMALVEYTVGCLLGQGTGVAIQLYGRYEAYNDECQILLNIHNNSSTECTPELQSITVPRPDPLPGWTPCERPGG